MRALFTACCLWLAIAASATAQDAQNGQGEIWRLQHALHLSAPQMGAWKIYQAAMAPDVQAQSRDGAAQRLFPQLTTPRRLALIQAVMEDHLAAFRRRSAAIVAFYEQLTPDQQRAYDQQTSPSASRNTSD